MIKDPCCGLVALSKEAVDRILLMDKYGFVKLTDYSVDVAILIAYKLFPKIVNKTLYRFLKGKASTHEINFLKEVGVLNELVEDVGKSD